MKKLVILLLSSILLLFGCSSSTEDGEVVVTGYASDTWLPAKIDEYNASGQSDVTFVWEPITDDYSTAVKTKIGGGEVPDILYVDPALMYELNASGRLVDLNEYIPTDYFAPMQTGVVETYQIDGAQYAMPYDYNVLTLYYNKDLFDQAGVPYPDESWTMDEFLSACEQLNATLPEGTAPVAINNAVNNMRVFAMNYGLDFYTDGEVTLDSPEMVEFVDAWRSMYEKEYFETGVDLGYGSDGEAFANGKAAMTVEGSWSVGMFNEVNPDMNWDSATIPVLNEGDEPNALVFSMGLGITTDSAYPQECADFLMWLMTPENQTQRAEETVAATGGSNLMVYEESNKALTDLEPRYATPIAAGEYGTSSLIGPYSATISQYVDQMCEKMKADPTLDTQQLLTETQDAINSEIESLQ